MRELERFRFGVLGKGKRLFAEDAKPTALELTHSRVSPTGLVAATYARAGKVKTGDKIEAALNSDGRAASIKLQLPDSGSGMGSPGLR